MSGNFRGNDGNLGMKRPSTHPEAVQCPDHLNHITHVLVLHISLLFRLLSLRSSSDIAIILKSCQFPLLPQSLFFADFHLIHLVVK